MPDGSIAVTFINGSIRTSEQEEMVHLLRKKSGLIVAFGSCSHIGGIPALSNLTDRESTLKKAYITTVTTTNPDNIYPQEEYKVKEGLLTLPKFFDHVYALDQIIDVDYYLPGCSVAKELIMNAVTAILEGKLPPKGSVLAPNKSLCETCPRNESKPEKLKITKIYRPYEIIIDPEKCFLEQGLICMGPATRTGCNERCITANMPCRGCMGPTDQVTDQGAKFLSAFASILDITDEGEIKKIIDQVVDPAGTFYRFSLSHSILKGKVK